LLALGEGSFDAAVSAMALMDMAEIAPLMKALTKLLKFGSCFLTYPRVKTTWILESSYEEG
jgi:hypothetical protein